MANLIERIGVGFSERSLPQKLFDAIDQSVRRRSAFADSLSGGLSLLG